MQKDVKTLVLLILRNWHRAKEDDSIVLNMGEAQVIHVGADARLKLPIAIVIDSIRGNVGRSVFGRPGGTVVDIVARVEVVDLPISTHDPGR
jgi:hypothetical protein